MYPGSDVFLQLAIIKFLGLLYEKSYSFSSFQVSVAMPYNSIVMVSIGSSSGS